MRETFQMVYLARHGETTWTITGQHTGLTDLPLTERGEANARKLGERLSGIPFAKVFTTRCNGPCGHANSPVLLKSLNWTTTWSNGITEVTRAALQWTYFENVRGLAAVPRRLPRG